MKKMLLLVTLLALVSIVSVAIAIQKPATDPASAAPVSTEPVKPTTEKKMEKMEKFSGLIEKVDEMGKAIVVRGKMMKEEKTLTFAINDKTKITKGKTTTTLGDLKKDMQVSIEYKKEMNKMIAVTIEVSVPKDAPKRI
jgi:hypothetical protein